MHKTSHPDSESVPPIVILGVPFDNTTTANTIKRIEQMVASRRPHHLVTANVDFLVQALNDVELHRILMDAHLVLCDGMPLVWASRLLGNPLPERVAGSDLVPLLIQVAARKGYRIFFLGGAPESASQAAANLHARYPDLKIAGHYSPPFAELHEMDHQEIRRRIQEAKPDLLFVSFGCPKQEKWIAMHYHTLGVPVSVGVGATIDFLAGRARRAPVWMRRAGAEWIFRLLQEPRRLFRRYLLDLWVFSRAILRQWWQMRGSYPAASVKAIPVKRHWKRVKLPSRFDKRNSSRVAHQSEVALEESRNCLLDLSGVRFIDSTGIGLLIRLRRKARMVNGRLILLAPSPAVKAALELMRLQHFFAIGHDAQTVRRLLEKSPEERPVLLVPNYFPSKPSIYWQGEITALNADQVWNRTQDHFAASAGKQPRLMIDLSALRFIDSAGLGLMLKAKKSAVQQGLDLVFTGAQPSVRNVLQLAKVESFLLRA